MTTPAHLPDPDTRRTAATKPDDAARTVPAYTPPKCDGCVPEADRERFAMLADEIAAYDDAPLWEDA